MSQPQETNSPQRQSLTVLPHSGKVEQLKAQSGRETSASEPKRQPARTPMHINRIAATQPDVLKTPQQRELEPQIITAMRQVFDPEIPVNIYDLGLIYDLEIDPDNNVHIRMTLTAPGCPVAGILPGQVEARVNAVPQVNAATVELVWDPPWSRDMMSEAAQLELGFL